MSMRSIKQMLKHNKGLNAFVAATYTLIHNFFHPMRRANHRGAYIKDTRFSICPTSSVTIGALARVRNCSFSISGKNCQIVIGGGKTVIANVSFCSEGDNSTIYIGEDFTMEGGEIAAIEGCSVKIGRDCMFSAGIDIRNGDSHVLLSQATGERTNPSRDIEIGNHVWITRNVSVLKGAVIAENCTIGTRSVVTGRCTTPNAIYAGCPAKLIKEGFNWNRFRN